VYEFDSRTYNANNLTERIAYEIEVLFPWAEWDSEKKAWKIKVCKESVWEEFKESLLKADLPYQFIQKRVLLATGNKADCRKPHRRK
jgi:hypothetical protein